MVNADEIREISEFINHSKNSYNEFDMNSQDIMNMIFANTDKIQAELEMYNSNPDYRDINDREEDQYSDTHVQHSQSRISKYRREHDEINNREIDEDSEEYGIEHQDDKLLEEHASEYLQNGLNKPLEEEKIHVTRETYETPYQRKQHDTNIALETVGEATIEETTKQDIDVTQEDKFYDTRSEREESKAKPKGKRGSKFSKLSNYKKDSSKILQEYNSYMQSEEESGRIEPEESMVGKTKQSNNSTMKPGHMSMSSHPRSEEELGMGSLVLLEQVLKQYKHCVK